MTDEVMVDDEFVDELEPGVELMHGQYTIECFLASGGFGITYLARDSLNRRVVIKECFPGNFCRRQNNSVVARSRAHQNELKSIVRLFIQEAMSLSKARHPNIVGVHQVFEENGTAYMALDFVEGRDLLDIITEEPLSLSVEQIEKYVRKSLDAIGHVHEQGILHRDISPDNILINAQDEPVLIDFGAARESNDEKTGRQLSALRVVKDGYSPQEFYIGGSEQNASCDLYSLAASFYHVITNQLPPDSQARLSAYAAGDTDPYVPLGEVAKGYDPRFCAALDKAMSVLPKERVQSAAEWTAMLNGEVIAQASHNAVGSPVSSSPKERSAFPLLAGTAAAAAIAGAAFFAGQEKVALAEVVPNPVIAQVAVAEFGSQPNPTDSIPTLPTPIETTLVAALPAQLVFSEPGVNIDIASESREQTTLEPLEVAIAEPAETEALGTPETASITADDVSSVMEAVQVVLPFQLSPEQGVVEEVFEGAPFWISAGTRIVSVDGSPVTTKSEFLRLVNTKARAADGEKFSINLGVTSRTDGTAIERQLTVTKETQTLLLNGLAFVTRPNVDGTWKTIVTQAPAASNFQTGDHLVAYVSTNERIDEKESFREIVKRELNSGTTRFSFVVLRAGTMWVEAFDLAALEQ